MKHFLLLMLVSLLILGCKKDLQPDESDYLVMAKNGLKDSVSTTDFEALDFARAARSRVDSIGLYVLRVPFKGKVAKEDFVLVKTNAAGRVEGGKIVHLEGKITEDEKDEGKRKRWDGTVSLASLDRKSVFRSAIANGYITAFHQGNTFRGTTEVVEGLMPEVIITYTITSSYGLSWSEMYMIQSLLGSGGDMGSGYYSSLSGGGDGGDPWNGGGSTGGSSYDPLILIDVETQGENDAIDLDRFINCFNTIPDAGATCSIEIFADIPVDSDPNKIFDFQSQSPGHTFVQIKKSNGWQSMIQNIGFYPETDWKSVLTNAPIEGKFVDNGEHEFNVSFFTPLTPAQLQSVLTELLYLRNVKYDIDNFNCTDWALEVFNKVRTDKLMIPLYDIPGNVPSLGARTPNGVYNRLREMKTSGHPEAANINFNFLKGYVARSTGPCN